MTVTDRTASMVPESLKIGGCEASRLEGLEAGRPDGEDAARVGAAPGEARRPGPANQMASHTATPAADADMRRRRNGVPVTESSSRMRTTGCSQPCGRPCGRIRPSSHQTAQRAGGFGKKEEKSSEGREAGTKLNPAHELAARNSPHGGDPRRVIVDAWHTEIGDR